MTPNEIIERVNRALRHMELVRIESEKLGKIFIQKGQLQTGLALIAAGRKHDISKLIDPMQFEDLVLGTLNKSTLKSTVKFHANSNSHHPEYWLNGIKDIVRCDVTISEFVIDTKVRSFECGTDWYKWIKTVATKKYGFKVGDYIYDKIISIYLLSLDRIND